MNLNYNRSDESLRIKTKHAERRVSGKATNTATRCMRKIAILRHADLQLNKKPYVGVYGANKLCKQSHNT